MNWEPIEAVIRASLEPLGFPLHSNRTRDESIFVYACLPQGDLDDLTVGVAVIQRGSGVFVRGDIVKQESGEIVYESPELHELVSNDPNDVYHAAERVAKRLTLRSIAYT